MTQEKKKSEDRPMKAGRSHGRTAHDDEVQRNRVDVVEREDRADSGPDRDNPITVRSGGTS